MPFSSWLLLAFALCGGALALTSVVAGRRLGWGNVFWFLAGLVVTELALFHVLVSAIVVAILVALGAATAWPGQAGLAIVGASWLALVLAQWRALPAARVLEAALQQGLGDGYRDGIPAERRERLRDGATWRELCAPFAVRREGVERVANLRYAAGHERWQLDVYRPATGVKHAPVLLQIHGGGWTYGSKDDQALPLIYSLAARGWVVVAANYRLSPLARFPDHLIDCKRALAWIRSEVHLYGGDPGFVAVTGGSAGGHLASLVALTPNQRALQPGFEGVDTRVAACVPFYGVYDFLDRAGVRGDSGAMTRLLARTVMPCEPQADPVLWDLASPTTHVREDAPPFFVLHGTHDSLAKVEEARDFVARLCAASHEPVVYAELPGAQHAWDLFHSVRSLQSVHAVERFLEWVHARYRAAGGAA